MDKLAQRACIVCGKMFHYSPRHYAMMGFELPKRCPTCSQLAKKKERTCVWKGNVKILIGEEWASLNAVLPSGCRKWKIGDHRAKISVYDHRHQDTLDGEAFLRVMYDRGGYFYLVLEEIFDGAPEAFLEVVEGDIEGMDTYWGFTGTLRSGKIWSIMVR